MKKIVFTGGGSAGHTVPNIALIKEIVNSSLADVCYIGSNGIEKTLVSKEKIPYYTIDPPKFVRGFSAQNFKIPFAFKKAVDKATEGLLTFRPDVVFSKGGYVSLPVVFSARKLHIPCITHESDLSAGLATKLMAKKCDYVLTSFPETAEKFKNGKFVGSPMRSEIFDSSKRDALKKYGFDGKKKVLLVFGGGSGSTAVNSALRHALPSLTEKYAVLHLTGRGNIVRSTYKDYKQIEYERDMGNAYAVADLIVSRAGSNSVFEILALKKPSLLIPLEGQTRGDQLENAEYFSKKGLVRILRQGDLSLFSEAVCDAFNDEELRQRLAVSDFSCGNGNILTLLKRYL